MERFDMIEVSTSTNFVLLANRHGLDIHSETEKLSGDSTERSTVWVDRRGNAVGRTVQHTAACQCGGAIVHHYMTREFKEKICDLEWELGKQMQKKFYK